MNNYDLITEQIEEINAKLKEIDKQMIIVEDIKPQFGNMDTFIPELEAAYKEFDQSLSNSITRTQTINKIVISDAIDEYTDIYRDLNEKCKTIIDDLLSSVNIVESPKEVITTKPILSYHDVERPVYEYLTEGPIITDKFINDQVDFIKPIDIGRIDDSVIPLPTPVQPEIEILDM